MQGYIKKIKDCELFAGISEDKIILLLNCLEGKIKTYVKNEYIHSDTDKVNSSGIVLSGAVQLVKYDYYGNCSIMSRIESLQLFGETYSFCEQINPMNIVASEDSIILHFNSKRISAPCNNYCAFHIKLINNLIKIISQKNLILSQKLECLSKRTTREKLLNYLSYEEKRAGTKEFVIPYDRQSLADYLCVERSAMSTEISKLCKEKIIECNKNKFRFL